MKTISKCLAALALLAGLGALNRKHAAQGLLALSLTVFSATICAQQADPCGGLVGFASGMCRGNQQKLQRQQQEQQVQEQQRAETCAVVVATGSEVPFWTLGPDNAPYKLSTIIQLLGTLPFAFIVRSKLPGCR